MRKFLICALVMLANVGCSDDERREEVANFEVEIPLDIKSGDLVPFDQMKAIAERVNDINTRLTRKEISEAEAAELIEWEMVPFVVAGRKVYEKMMEVTDLSSLPKEEQTNLILFDDEETRLAELGFVYSIGGQTEQFEARGWTGEQIRDCLGAALGIGEIGGLIKNTRALMTVAGVRQVAVLIIKRYVLWVAVALAVYDFMDCMDAF